jgi:hypothetical protein
VGTERAYCVEDMRTAPQQVRLSSLAGAGSFRKMGVRSGRWESHPRALCGQPQASVRCCCCCSVGRQNSIHVKE